MAIYLDRRSVRVYDKDYKIKESELREILNKTLRAPSSMNLQPTRLVVIESSEGKDKVKPALYGNNSQLKTSQAFIVIFTDLEKYKNAQKIFAESVEQNLMPHEVASQQLALVNRLKNETNKDRILREGLIDAGLFAMQLMLVAKDYGYDTCPIGGFNKDTIATILGMNSKRYEPVLIVSLGKAKEPGFNSHRLKLDDIARFI